LKPERTPNETSLKSLLSVALQTFAVAHRPLVLATDAVETLVEMVRTGGNARAETHQVPLRAQRALVALVALPRGVDVDALPADAVAAGASPVMVSSMTHIEKRRVGASLSYNIALHL
jgi:hypothetical protein